MSEAYLVGRITVKRPVNIPSIPPTKADIKLSWADGMIGALPVFDNIEDANEYANGAQIFVIELPEASDE